MFIIISKNWRYVSYSLEIANPRDPSIRDPLIRDPLNIDAQLWRVHYVTDNRFMYILG